MRRHCPRRDTVKSAGEIMEILEAFDLTECYRDAAEPGSTTEVGGFRMS